VLHTPSSLKAANYLSILLAVARFPNLGWGRIKAFPRNLPAGNM
jgi:hypothetical protein